MEYVDRIFEIVKSESDGLDAVYRDFIIHLVGTTGMYALLDNNRVESCGVVNGRQLFTLCEEK